MRWKLLGLLLLVIFFASCRSSYTISRKYSPADLKADYRLMQEILEAKHPSLYWYTPKDSMDKIFGRYYKAIKDSMTEAQFTWKILAPTLTAIRCGHTTLMYSKAYAHATAKLKLPSFPYHLRAWNDSLAVLGPVSRQDTSLRRGTIIKSINGWPADKLIHFMFDFLPQDGYAETINYNRLSGNFPAYHRNIMGLSRKYAVEYIDSTNKTRRDSLNLFFIKADTTKKKPGDLKKVKKEKMPKVKRSERMKRFRSMVHDSARTYALLDLNSFTKGNLRGFYRKSFRELADHQTPNLIIDLRTNGGGRVGLSTLLTKYISRQPFKVADTVFALSHSVNPYGRYLKNGFFNTLQLFFTSRKMEDGKYHMRHFEKKVYKPKKNNHFGGRVFIITAGPTFSASCLFAGAVKGQEGITLVGEETGGGAYGNSGILIPEVKLPHTDIRFRLPLFRLVQHHRPAEKGNGIFPDVEVPPTLSGIKNRVDEKMQATKKLIGIQTPDE